MDVGHVEKTNDRDYEVEERCGTMIMRSGSNTEFDADGSRSTLAGDTVQWNQQQFDSKRKQKGIWTHYEVGSRIGFSKRNERSG